MKHNSQIHAYGNIYKIHSRFIFFFTKKLLYFWFIFIQWGILSYIEFYIYMFYIAWESEKIMWHIQNVKKTNEREDILKLWCQA